MGVALTRQSRSSRRHPRIVLSGATKSSGGDTAVRKVMNNVIVKAILEPLYLSAGRTVECFSQDVFFHFGASVCVDFLVYALVELLFFGVNVHGHFQEGLVKERNTGFKSPSHR